MKQTSSSMTRRELLRICAAAATFAAGGTITAHQELAAATAVVDHLMLGASDLDAGIAWVERLTGVRATSGGAHPGRGTRNALLSLGRGQYLEIIAPDPAQVPEDVLEKLRESGEPRLVGWAAAAVDIDALARKLRDAGFQTSGAREGSRATPDGRVLEWRTLSVSSAFRRDSVDPVPFFIEWGAGTMHPSQDSARGCELTALEFEHPEAEQVRRVLQRLGIDATVKTSARVRLTATLKTPKGIVSLS
jgi:hypothetical protein